MVSRASADHVEICGHLGVPVKPFMRSLEHSGSFYRTFLYLLGCHVVYTVLYKP